MSSFPSESVLFNEPELAKFRTWLLFIGSVRPILF
jgi:hypothetical protein